MDNPRLPRKGDKYEGPNGHGYIVTTDIYPGQTVSVKDFEPFGGAPKPIAGAPMPDWLSEQIREIVYG